MTELAPCPICKSPYTYQLESLLVCPECGHEWNASEETAVDEGFVVKDSNGNILLDGDKVVPSKTCR